VAPRQNSHGNELIEEWRDRQQASASQSPAAPHAVIWRDPGDMASLDLFYRAGGKGQITRNIPRADAKWLGHRPSMLSAAQVRDGFRAAGYTRQEVETYTEAMRKRIAEFQAL
jgi:hypothetical protein